METLKTLKTNSKRARIDLIDAKRRLERASRAYQKLVVYDPASMPAGDRLAREIDERRALEEYCAALTGFAMALEAAESAYAALENQVMGGR